MKFIAKKDAPDIPLKVINARDNNELVLFCGSGISMPAGLKTFKGLVDQVYGSLATEKDELESEYYDDCLYDRVLELLEYRYFKRDRANKYLIRQNIIENLILDKDADLSTHIALLELAKTEDGRRRLVTTNVDRGFVLAEPTLEMFIDAAPKLPFPKPHQWYSIVHLHGIIDDEIDPDRKGENLVFTSGDFGTAYLTERWASKFVAELFRNFTVLFVGYSVNDPVVRYMTDAIAAERRKGDTHFHQPYILAAIQDDRDKAQRAWQAKGIEPILYDSTDKHIYLHDTLKNWAANCRDGLRSQKRIIQKSSRIIPVPPFEDDEIKEIIDTLQEKHDQHDKALTGIPAKCFSELDPPSDIAWLPALDKYGLFNQYTVPESCAPFSWSSEYEQYCNLVKPNAVTGWLWKWLIKHLASKDVVHWVIDKGASLHSELLDLIKEKINSEDKPDEPFLTFWRIIVSGSVLTNSSRINVFNIVRQLKENASPLNLQEFLFCLKPKVKFSKPLIFIPDAEEPPYEAEVVIEEQCFNTLYEYHNSYYSTLLIPVIFELSLLLKDAMELFQAIGLASSQEDRSCFDQPSIAPHKQNKRYNNWAILIELCRDVWLSAWEKNRGIALATLELWKNIEFPVFRRLVLYAYTAKDIVTPAEALAYLLEADNWWLWNFHTEREKYRILHKVWPALSENDTDKLVDIIITGPKRKMYREELTENEWRKAKDWAVWHLLAKLASFGGDLTPAGQKVLADLSLQYPKWQLSDDERDEFNIWMGDVSVGYECDLSLDDLIELPPKDLIEKLVQESKYHDGRISLFRTFCKDNPEKASDVLELLFRDNLWENEYQEIWVAALIGIGDAEKKQFSRVAYWLQKSTAEFYQQKSLRIADYLKKVAKEDIDPDDEKLLWDNVRKVLNNARIELNYCSCTELPKDSGASSQAINASASVRTIAELLIVRLSRMGIKAKAGIPQGDLRDVLERLTTEEKFTAARGVFASRLHYFHWLDQDWTKEHLLGRMSWKCHEEAKFLWQEYLSNATLDVDLFLDIKTELIAAIDHVSLLGDISEHLFQLIAIILLSLPPDSFTKKEKKELLCNIGPVGRREVTETFLRSRMVNNSDETDESFWSNQLKPLLNYFWPKDNSAIDSITSQHLARLAVRAGEKFQEAIQTVKNIIGSVLDIYPVIIDLNASNLPENHPEIVLELLGMIFTEESQCSKKVFQELMHKLITHRPELKNDLIYQKIDKFLQ